jgi:hypothetical protein
MELLGTSHVERFKLTLRHTVGRTRRHCLAFSRKLENHRTAVALGIAAYNFVRILATLATTPAVASGLAERPWALPELVAAAMEEPETEAPEAKPLAPRPGAVAPARRTSTGRTLRLVHGGSAQAPLPVPTAAPPIALSAVPPSLEPTGQLDLLAWRPRLAAPAAKPSESRRVQPVQLDLFGQFDPGQKLT